MSNEFGDRLVEDLMRDHWDRIEDKAYPALKGVWDNKKLLPATWLDSFETKSEASPLEIPLVGDGYVKFGLAGINNPDIDMDILAPNSKGVMTESGTILTAKLAREEYGFWIFFDNPKDPGQTNAMKFLAGFNPEKDIDWERVQKGTPELEISLAMCASYGKRVTK